MALTIPTYEEAIQTVKSQVTASRSSFQAGMAILPKDRREAMFALYGFCRIVDDIADESPSPDIAARGLADWRQRIQNVFQNKPSDPITVCLIPAIRDFGLVEKDFQDIIDGMEMDSKAIIAPTIAELDLYCDRVASAVGRASVRIFGHSGADAMQVSYHLGRALQLTNILRDLAEDATRGRLYLPSELLDKHGITTRDPNEVLTSSSLPLVCRDLAARAGDHYANADIAMNKCPATTMRPARIMRAYYRAIYDRLCKEDWHNPTKRIGLSKITKLRLLVKGYCS